jgi:hypothetical protein
VKAESPNLPGDQSSTNQKGSGERNSQQHRGQVFLGVFAILAIGLATTLALVLLNLITNHP